MKNAFSSMAPAATELGFGGNVRGIRRLLFSSFAQFLVTIHNSLYMRGSCSLQRVIKDTQDLSSHCVTNHWGWTGIKRRKLPISLRSTQLPQHDSKENPFPGPIISRTGCIVPFGCWSLSVCRLTPGPSPPLSLSISWSPAWILWHHHANRHGYTALRHHCFNDATYINLYWRQITGWSQVL